MINVLPHSYSIKYALKILLFSIRRRYFKSIISDYTRNLFLPFQCRFTLFDASYKILNIIIEIIVIYISSFWTCSRFQHLSYIDITCCLNKYENRIFLFYSSIVSFVQFYFLWHTWKFRKRFSKNDFFFQIIGIKI